MFGSMPRESDDTCWTMVRSAASGDGAARTAFTRDYQRVLREFFDLRWRGHPLRSDVDDATQEVFVECLKPGGVLDRAEAARGSFRGLLYGVARNVARRHEQRARRDGRMQPEDSRWLARVVDDEAGQATLFDRSWAREVVRRAHELHRRRSEAEGEDGRRRIELLESRFGANEPIRTIAARWGVDPRVVHNAYRRARSDFYGALREVVAFHAPADVDLDAECRKLLQLL
jgi:hypothetical protein